MSSCIIQFCKQNEGMDSFKHQGVNGNNLRPEIYRADDDEDDEDEEVIFILPQQLLKGKTRNQASECSSYDSETSSGLSEKDRSQSPAGLKLRRSIDRNMGSTATSCQNGSSDTFNYPEQTSYDQQVKNESGDLKTSLTSERSKSMEASRTDTHTSNQSSLSSHDFEIHEERYSNRSSESQNSDIGSKTTEIREDSIEVDYVNVTEHLPRNQGQGQTNIADVSPDNMNNLQSELADAVKASNNYHSPYSEAVSDNSKDTSVTGGFSPKNECKQPNPSNVQTITQIVKATCEDLTTITSDETELKQRLSADVPDGVDPANSQSYKESVPEKETVKHVLLKMSDNKVVQKIEIPNQNLQVLSGNETSQVVQKSSQNIASASAKVNYKSSNSSAVKKNPAYSFDEILVTLKEKVQGLLNVTDFTNPHARSDLKFIRRTTRYSPDVHLNKRLVNNLVEYGIVHVFLRVWKSVTRVDFMNFEKNLSAFKNLQTALSIIWNCTDKSPRLCESLVSTGVVLSFIEELGSEKVAGSNLSHENNLYLVKAYLGILHNVARLCADSRRTFRGANAVKILQWYLVNKNDLIKTNAYLVLSYVINEDENDIINANADNIQFIVHVLRDALSGENHFSKQFGFWALEVICGLNHLAVNDGNKIRIGACGALPMYMRLLQDGSEDEKSQAASGLWILAFKEENKYLLREEPGCIDVLSKLAASGSTENIRRAARGALWVVQSVHDKPAPQTMEELDIPHVMVSYHHKSGQKMMIKVVRRLRQAGYKIWMDLDDMHGSTLEAMALAIERSCCVLVCMTQGYKDSPSCRTEAEYTYRLRKDVIPLLLQDGYVPDGWLGAFVGTRLHFDFSSEDKIATEVQKVVRELGSRGRLPMRGCRIYTDQRAVSVYTSSDSFDGSSSWGSSSTGGHSYSAKFHVTQWTQEEIRTWLEAHMLSHVWDRFEPITGELLVQLKVMQKSAPEFFYNSLEHKFKFDLVTILKFTRALEEIKEHN